MDNQHRRISGYRDIDQSEIDLMNEIKAFGVQLDVLISRVRFKLSQQTTPSDLARHQLAEPQRWASEAKTDLQKGLMALTRAVAQPTNF